MRLKKATPHPERPVEDAEPANASQFARDVGVQPNTIYRYERGEQMPSPPVLARIAKLTGRTMEWITTGEDVAQGETYLAWLGTPIGGTASIEARRFLETLPTQGYEVSLRFYDLALQAFEHGLTAAEAVRAAATTVVAKRG